MMLLLANETEVFHCLSSPCDNLTQSEIGVLEEFAVIMYDRSSSTNKVNDASLDLFANDVQCGTQTPLSFSQPHLEGHGKVGDLHSDCPQVCPVCKTDLLICSIRAALEGTILYAAVTALNLGLSRPIKPLQPVFWRMCSEHIYEMIL
jgi:hypothetical protein